MQWRRTAALAMALCMAGTGFMLQVPSMETTVMAEDAQDAVFGDYSYKIIEDYVEITGFSETAETADIPADIEGLPVKSIATSAFYGRAITSVTFPSTLTSIGGGAFWNCTGLTSVILPDGVTSIANNAFSGCTELSEIQIPASVTDIGYSAFSGTLWLSNKKAEDPFVIVNGILIDASAEVERILAEQAAKEQETDVLPTEEETEKSEVVVTVPQNVTVIGEKIFDRQANKVQVVVLPDGVARIGKMAFNQCKSLYDINIPETVAEIGDKAFFGTPWLASQLTEEGFIIINNILFDGKNTSGDVVIPDDVKAISGNAFYDNKKITSVFIPESVTSIGASAFAGCAALTSPQIPSSVTYIGKQAFSECTFDTLEIPASVEEIGERAFSNNPNLSGVTLYGKETQIGYQAFGYTITFNLTAQYSYIFVISKNDDFAFICYEDSPAGRYAAENGMQTDYICEPGDVDGNSVVNAVDASYILIHAAAVGAGNTDSAHLLSRGQLLGGDVNGDGELDAVDASIILVYAAKRGVGRDVTLADCLDVE